MYITVSFFFNPKNTLPMSDKLEKLQKIRKQVRSYEDTLSSYEKLYIADGTIDAHEQKLLDTIKNLIKKTVAKIEEEEGKLGWVDAAKNVVNANVEAIQDWNSTEDDIVDHSLVEKKINTSPSKSKDNYTVVSGDTGYGIAKKNGISFDALSLANAGVKWSGLGVGQTLNIPSNSTDNKASETSEKPDAKFEIKPIKNSVGADIKKSKAKNDTTDVRIVQLLLNENGIKVAVTGVCDDKTIAAIKKFQANNFSWTPDGNIGLKGQTWPALSLGKIKDTHEVSADGLGVGAANIDSYKSQRDNETLSLPHSSSKKRSGDVQCNVTSLAMMLISLNGGNEAEVIDIVKKAIKKEGGTYKSSWGLEELLAQYTDTIGKSIHSSSRMGKIAVDLLTDKVASFEAIEVNENKPQDAIDECKNTIIPLLKKGSEVIISGRFTHGGHIVSLRSVKSSGVMIQDPYGLCIAQGVYMKNGKVFSKSNFAKYQMNIKRRLSVNGRFEEIKAMVEAGKALPQNLGSNNYYSWDDFGSMKIYRFVVAHKK